MSGNFLKLNQDKPLTVFLRTLICFSETCISDLTWKAFSFPRTVAKLRLFLPKQAVEKLTHAFITSGLDCCKVLFTGLPKKVSGKTPASSDLHCRTFNKY